MAVLRPRSLIISACSLLMGFLFAYSASVQFNDPDWYFWIPLYALASGINFLQVGGIEIEGIVSVAVVVKWGALILFCKVLMEGYVKGMAGFESLDMRERVVREKIGSGLVALSMILQLKASQAAKEENELKKERIIRTLEIGMGIMLAVAFGLTIYFFAFVHYEMKF